MSNNENGTAGNGAALATAADTSSTTDYIPNDGKTLANVDEIRAALGVLFVEGDIVEMRAPKAPNGDGGTFTASGYYTDFDRLAADAAEDSGNAPGIYVTLNPIKPELQDRVTNSFSFAGKATADNDIASRRWFPIDLDPVRRDVEDQKVPTTDAEHDAGLNRAKTIRQYLTERGWPEPVYADSGNGAWLLYRIALPNDDDAKKLLKRCLDQLAAIFSDDKVKLDTSTYNASRIVKLFGTLSAKGEATPERPHRLSRLIDIPPSLSAVTVEQLTDLAAESKPEKPAAGFDMATWIRDHNLEVSSEGPWQETGYKWVLAACPFDGVDGTDPHGPDAAAMIGRVPGGGFFFKCQHSRHEDKKWRDLRDLLEPGWRDDRGGDEPSRNQATILVNLVSNDIGAELWRDADGDGWITAIVNDRRENYPIESEEFLNWAKWEYYRRFRSAIGDNSVNNAKGVLIAKAKYEGEQHAVFTRTAEYDGKVYIDLTDEQRNVVEVTRDGWTLVPDPPVRFTRISGIEALPVPEKGGDIRDLRTFLNSDLSDDTFRLFVAWMVQALLPETFGSYPLAVLNGGAGSGKTTALKIAVRLTDPNRAEDSAPTKTTQDLMLMATSQHVLSWDNVSYISPSVSDDLARLATGATFISFLRSELSTAATLVIRRPSSLVRLKVLPFAREYKSSGRSSVRTPCFNVTSRI